MIKTGLKRIETFTELDFYQIPKNGQRVCGDAFFSEKYPGKRVISILADGLGSGIKASVLATLTTSMAARFIKGDMDIQKAAAVIMRTLPICAVRKIGYSTFTIIDIRYNGKVRIIESGNPPCILFRNGKALDLGGTTFEVKLAEMDEPGRPQALPAVVSYKEFELQQDDRLFAFSDGVTQAGMGKPEHPLGWGDEAVTQFITKILNDSSIPGRAHISARAISKMISERACSIDHRFNKDDITSCCIYFRKPRKTMVFTGPPYSKNMDSELARNALNFTGKKIICGGTTAGILSRELNRPVEMDMSSLTDNSPPISIMKGFDLVTEGTITLGKLSGYLKTMAEKQGGVGKNIPNDYTENDYTEKNRSNNVPYIAVKKLADMLISSDYIKFIVGTRINEAHQDPSLPEELDIRRNIIKKIINQLKRDFLKEVAVEFI